jgi:hypothetical protein
VNVKTAYTINVSAVEIAYTINVSAVEIAEVLPHKRDGTQAIKRGYL